ncbi:MAG: DedA family protein [Pseudomonadaceae bacterium]|nr:DedA family protein [Pseudomonadaceae bacterium]
MSNPLRRLYGWTLAQANGRYAPRALFAVSFAESSFFPIPPDVMLLPMCFADKAKAWRYAAICTLGSVLGGVAGYAIGALLWGAVGQPILEFYHLEAKMDVLEGWYAAYGAWVILLAGFTPLPYKLFTIASGVFGFPLLPFVALSAVSRGARFYLVAGLMRVAGPTLKRWVDSHLEWLTIGFAVLLVGGFVAVRYLVG